MKARRILTIGPTLKVDVMIKGTANANVDLDVGLSYKVNNAQVYFPSRHGTSGGGFAPSDTSRSCDRLLFTCISTDFVDLQLAVAPNTTLLGTVEGHIIPTVSGPNSPFLLSSANLSSLNLVSMRWAALPRRRLTLTSTPQRPSTWLSNLLNRCLKINCLVVLTSMVVSQ